MKFLFVVSLSLAFSECATAEIERSTNLRHLKKDDNPGGGNAVFPLERVPGSCVDADQAFDDFPGLQGRFGTRENFKDFCGFEGSCMGEEKGCCRITNGQALECDLEVDFPGGVCICNQFTAEPAPRTGGGGDDVDVDGDGEGPPLVPTMAPTALEDNCQRFNSTSPFYIGVASFFPGLPFVTYCFEDSDCPASADGTPPCCMASFCFCYDSNFPPGLTGSQCIGGATIGGGPPGRD